MRSGLTLPLLLLTACGAPPGPAADAASQEWPHLVHTLVTFTPTYAAPDHGLPRPQRLDAILSLSWRQDDRYEGTIALLGGRATLASATGRVATRGYGGGEPDGANATAELDPGFARAWPYGELRWQTLGLTLTGTSDRLDHGSGQAAGEWRATRGDVIDQTPFTATITAAPDTQGERVELEPPDDTRERSAILPIDRLYVALGEPVPVAAATASAVVRANGQPIPGRLEADQAPIDGRVTSAWFSPSALLPFGAELLLDPAGLTDPVGNPLQQGSPLRTVDDPGAVGENLGFERALAGWIVPSGYPIELVGTYYGLAPAEGSRQLIVHERAFLAGYLDLPRDASELSLSLALFSEIGEVDRDRTAVVAVWPWQAGGARTVVFDAYDERQNSVPCDACGIYHQRMGPVRRSVSLEPFRGQRILLTAEVRPSYFIGVNYFALAVDDLRIR